LRAWVAVVAFQPGGVWFGVCDDSDERGAAISRFALGAAISGEKGVLK
jgi:hypothetical protein